MSSYGTGSALQQGIQAATAAVRGLAGGNIGQAVSGAASPYLAEQIHKLTDGNPQAQAIAHAVVRPSPRMRPVTMHWPVPQAQSAES